MERTHHGPGETAEPRSATRRERTLARTSSSAETSLRVLHRILAGLASCDSVAEIVERVAAELAALVRTREVWWLDQEAGTLRRLAGGSAQLDERPLAALEPQSAAALAQAHAADAPIVLALERAVEGGAPEKLALLAAPVRHRGRTLAVLGILSGRGEALQGPIVEVMAALTDPIAAAMDRVRLREYLAEEKALWESAFDSIADPVLLVESGHRVLRANRAALAALRALPRGSEAELCAALCGPRESERHEPCALAEAIAAGAPRSRELHGLFGHAGRATLVSSFPIQTRDGSAPRAVQIYRDVTRERELQQELVRSEQLSAAGKIAAGMAHEIRNPLAAITNAVSVLGQGLALGSEDRELVEIVLEESRRVNRIVGDFLGFARPAAGEFAPARLEALVDSTARLLRKDPRCAEGVMLEVDLEPDLPAVMMDRDRVRQVVWNLLLNAVQAVGARGKVLTRVRRARSGDADGVLVEVADSGSGIAAALGERVFDPFETTKPNGTGLGLSLARHIVELHSGWIRADRSEGGGAAMRFWLPITRRAGE